MNIYDEQNTGHIGPLQAIKMMEDSYQAHNINTSNLTLNSDSFIRIHDKDKNGVQTQNDLEETLLGYFGSQNRDSIDPSSKIPGQTNKNPKHHELTPGKLSESTYKNEIMNAEYVFKL